MGRIVIFPYKIASASSRGIADALQRNNGKNTIRVYPNRRYTSRVDDLIVNWGNSREPQWAYNPEQILNKPSAVALAVNKLRTFEKLSEAGVRTVPWTVDIDEARQWHDIVERHTLTGSGGAGIRISTPDTIQPAPLYTKLLNPCEEYRVHIFKGEAIDYAKKMKQREDGTYEAAPAERIKNAHNGFYFLRDVSPREGVVLRAREAIEALGLDFGAVDIIRYRDRSYVLEVGTAAGVSPMGQTAYANAITEYAEQE
jgi:hypothetical protein